MPYKTLKDLSKADFTDKNYNFAPPVPPKPRTSFTSRNVPPHVQSQLPPVPPKPRTSFTSRNVPPHVQAQLQELVEESNKRKSIAVVVNVNKTDGSSVYNNGSISDTAPSPSQYAASSFTPVKSKANAMMKWLDGVAGPTTTRTKLKERVEQAIRNRKVFSILGTCEPIQQALFSRGWVEIPNTEISWVLFNTKPLDGVGTLDSRLLRNYYDRAAVIHQTLRDCTANLIWNASLQPISWREIEENQMVNQSPGAKAVFCSKVGIIDCVLDSHWFRETEISDLNFPRCYRLDSEEEKVVFINDFRLTACVSLLQWLTSSFEKQGLGGITSVSNSGKTRWWSVDFAITHIEHYAKVRRNENIDGELELQGNHINQWETFLSQFNKIVPGKLRLPSEIKLKEANDVIDLAKGALIAIQPFRPNIHADGMNNIWICKPAFGSRGQGILITNRLDEILGTQKPKVSINPMVASYDGKNIVVQKYIERPLLIHKTKFDIRQWFFVACWNPLSLWLYKDCYLRFCTDPFDLERFHPRIHLCNTEVQRRYSVATKYRDAELPPDNIWDLAAFRKYLKELGKEDIWDSILYPRMKQSILSVVLPCQNRILEGGSKKVRRNSFELFGADFLITEDFTPWLIEVNCSPLMQGPSAKFKKLARQCFEDCIKVAIDRRVNFEASTGKFELVFKQEKALDTYIQARKGNLGIYGSSLNSNRTTPPRYVGPILSRPKKKKIPKVTRANINITLGDFTVDAKARAKYPDIETKIRIKGKRKSSDEDGSKEKPKKNSHKLRKTDSEEFALSRETSLQRMISIGSVALRYRSKSAKTVGLSECSMHNNLSTPAMNEVVAIKKSSISGRSDKSLAGSVSLTHFI